MEVCRYARRAARRPRIARISSRRPELASLVASSLVSPTAIWGVLGVFVSILKLAINERTNMSGSHRNANWPRQSWRSGALAQRCLSILALSAALVGASRARADGQVAHPTTTPPLDSAELINADRPGIADGSRVIQAGQLQIEIGAQLERRRDGGVRTTTTFVPLLIRFGVSDRIEARVESNSLTSNETSSPNSPTLRVTGYSPVSIGAKYQLHDSGGDHRRSFGVIARVFAASGSSNFRADRYSGDVRLAADWDFAPQLSLNPNVGIARQEDDQGRTFTAALGAMTLTYSPTDRISPFVDLGAQSPEARGEGAAIIVDAGLGYTISRDIQLDISAGSGVRGSTPARPFVAVGVSIRHR